MDIVNAIIIPDVHYIYIVLLLWKAAVGGFVLRFREKGQVVLLGDFNACVGI